MLELAKIVDSFPSGPGNRQITFDVEVAKGQIQMSFDRADPNFNTSMVALCFACGLDGMKDTHELNGIPFMIDRDCDPMQLYQIEQPDVKTF